MNVDVARRAIVRARWAWVASFVVLAGVTAGLLPVRGQLDKAYVVLAFLLVVLGGSAAGGRLLGIALSTVAFLLFDLVFLPPYYTLVISDPLDWLVLVAFLITGIVAAQLLARADERAEAAQQRAIEVERLAVLGAETLNVGRAEDALGAIARVIQSTLGVACCEIFIQRGHAVTFTRAASAGACGNVTEADEASLAAWVARAGIPAAERDDRTAHLGTAPAVESGSEAWSRAPAWHVEGEGEGEGDVRALLVPLRVHRHPVGVLRIAADHPMVLDPEQHQFLDALSYYAALGVERVRLAAEAERAEALRQADQLKDALIAAVSHDLRTPLTTIKALAHALSARGQHEASTIEHEADRLNRMVADLLDLSRLNAGAMSLRIELNVADEIVGAAVRSVRGVAGGRTIAVHAADATMYGVSCDLVQAVRVLVNLLENALKYSPADAAVELEVRRRDAGVEFAVLDRGPGIPESERERVFAPFYRPAHVAPDAGGAGLGLAIARRLAEAQGGRLVVGPRAGGGSVFTFSLPGASIPTVGAEVR